MKVCGWQVWASSKAGFATAIAARYGKRIKIAFDMGLLSAENQSANHVFISHCHTDHVGAIFLHARHRGLSGKPATYYVPQGAKTLLEMGRQAFEALDSLDARPFLMNIVELVPGDIVNLEGNCFYVQCFAVNHRVAAQGYCVFQIDRSGVRDGLPAAHVAELCYTGDTLFSALQTPELDFVWKAKILLLELSFLSDVSVDKARQKGHVHLAEVAQWALHGDPGFQNQHIVFLHLSNRYSPLTACKEVAQHLAPLGSWRRRVSISLTSWGLSDQVAQNMWDVACGFPLRIPVQGGHVVALAAWCSDISRQTSLATALAQAAAARHMAPLGAVLTCAQRTKQQPSKTAKEMSDQQPACEVTLCALGEGVQCQVIAEQHGGSGSSSAAAFSVCGETLRKWGAPLRDMETERCPELRRSGVRFGSHGRGTDTSSSLNETPAAPRLRACDTGESPSCDVTPRDPLFHLDQAQAQQLEGLQLTMNGQYCELSGLGPRLLDLIHLCVLGKAEFRIKDHGTYLSATHINYNAETFPPGVNAKLPTRWLLALRRECCGLLVCKSTGQVLARRFHKFFAATPTVLPLLHLSRGPPVLLPKLDGVLASPAMLPIPPAFRQKSSPARLRWLTKTAVHEDLEKFVAHHGAYATFARESFDKGYTPLFEWCRPGYGVVRCQAQALILLAMRHNDNGSYLPYRQVWQLARTFGLPVVRALDIGAQIPSQWAALVHWGVLDAGTGAVASAQQSFGAAVSALVVDVADGANKSDVAGGFVGALDSGDSLAGEIASIGGASASASAAESGGVNWVVAGGATPSGAGTRDAATVAHRLEIAIERASAVEGLEGIVIMCQDSGQLLCVTSRWYSALAPLKTQGAYLLPMLCVHGGALVCASPWLVWHTVLMGQVDDVLGLLATRGHRALLKNFRSQVSSTLDLATSYFDSALDCLLVSLHPNGKESTRRKHSTDSSLDKGKFARLVLASNLRFVRLDLMFRFAAGRLRHESSRPVLLQYLLQLLTKQRAGLAAAQAFVEQVLQLQTMSHAMPVWPLL